MSNTDRVALASPLAGGWLDRLGLAATAALLRRLCGLGGGPPHLRVSRDWLDEHERRSRTPPDGS